MLACLARPRHTLAARGFLACRPLLACSAGARGLSWAVRGRQLGRRIALLAAPLPSAPPQLPPWLLRLPLLGTGLRHLSRRPTWPGHAAFALSGLSFLVTDMLWLRGIASLSCLLAIAFNACHPVGRALWLPIWWNVGYVTVNLSYMASLLSERVAVLSADEAAIYTAHCAGAMRPADFRRLLRAGRVVTASSREELLTRGQVPDILVLVFEGCPEVEVEEGVTLVRPGGLIGELSFLHGCAASATVRVAPPCRYVVWERAALDALLAKDPSLRSGIELLIARELTRKLVHSNRALVKATRESEYERFVAHTALRLLLADGAQRRAGGGAPAEPTACGGLFDELKEHRLRAGVSPGMHSRVLRAAGVDEAASRREGHSLEAVCSAIAAGRLAAEPRAGSAAAEQHALGLQRMMSSAGVAGTRAGSWADSWADSR